MNKKQHLSGAVSRILAPSFLHMQLLQVASGCALVYAIFWIRPQFTWWLVSVGVYFLTACLGLSISMHRALTHRSITLSRPLEMLFSLFGLVGGSGSPIGWIAMHRAHHAYVDTPRDPHYVQGLGWSVLFSRYSYAFNPMHVRDLMRDSFQVFIHRYYVLILLIWSVFLTVLDFRLLIFVFMIPAFTQITVSNLSNILLHSQGYRLYDTPDRSTNNIMISLLSWGEGWHNNHHAEPSSWNLRRRWWEFDISAIVIALLISIGLARESVHSTAAAS